MGGCKIKNCPVKKGQCSMFSVPFEPKNRKIWIDIIEKYQEFDYIPQQYPICELHFDPIDIMRKGHRTQLKPGSLPKYFKNLDFKRLENREKIVPKRKKTKKTINQVNTGSILDPVNVNIKPKFNFVAVESIVKTEPNTIPLEYEYNNSIATESLSVCDASTQTEDIKLELRNGNKHSSTSTEATQSQSLSETTNSSSTPNGIKVCISRTEYARLLQNDVKYTDLKMKYEKKAKLIKTLQDSVSYFKKKLSILNKKS